MEQKIVIIGTGGTIAGQASDSGDVTKYKAGAVGVAELMHAVPNLLEYGPFEAIQFSNIDSSDMKPFHWSRLAEAVQTAVDRPDVCGVVITHGTDTMEETAYFLELTVDTEKPVVLTGAMRPATALSADGPLNLLQAVIVARSKAAQHRGVLVALNGYVDSALYVTKQHTTDVATFGNAMTGHMGLIQDGVVRFFYEAPSETCRLSLFKRMRSTELDAVEIIYMYAGADAGVLDYYVEQGVKGFVLAGLGHGSVPQVFHQKIKTLGCPVLRTSRVPYGIVTESLHDNTWGTIPTYGLTPVKARIFLMLALRKGLSHKEILEICKSL